MNQPNRIDSWLLQDDEKPLTITEDPKIPNAATILLRKQDHTLGNMIRAQLLLDPTVLFAGYKVPHPLENDIIIKIQTDERSNPADALKRACHLLIRQTVQIKSQFMEQAKNIEMGMGPDQSLATAQTNGYDPYADSSRQGNTIVGGQFRDTNAGGADVYDF
ncbi:DNA-directed RNA polymerase II subunit RPB11 [Kwoniella mangroviensis CBS 10435]|uniref:DNA-directed RNA polymerase II subunit RPB11 n=1 Tax=Kwoniella mangroviensis CBS 10435 TaxID=1331196 RepID=A0A1B9IFF2_9TREE|nr:DNA-directed RNA polymerase II subunit RPB11 [Kwoniella mangroviensis CBS 8507]OCF54161.1 DNA-directed RNA polymerase II subunit RPB11 [Kwoniella mangroviensis CBS 10435]OCF66032.1 DNA-directed RNA polymerase II subunit RPB11 [Kwoniella mangroviensis CBS 8507]OCF71894.1 DNA-directed RNA polymerase II subunit RPB11 [Kwoniella mangroviensis CBS 8886]